jgi:hypothetical protein
MPTKTSGRSSPKRRVRSARICSLHQRPRHADKARVRDARFESPDEACTKNIAGGFSGDQGNRQGTRFSH